MANSSHPLERFSSLSELLELPYFELLAVLTDQSLHPGGGAATQLLLDTCRLKRTDHVLEVGCGPGWTTRALIKAGIDVSVVEASALMIDAMFHHCDQAGLSRPHCINTDIQSLTEQLPFGHKFDLILLECVVGFIEDKQKLSDTIKRNLDTGGRVGVLDVHYKTMPSLDLQNRLFDITGHRIEPMNEDDWRDIFPGLELREFAPFDLPERPGETSATLVEKAQLSRWMPNLRAAEIDQLTSVIEQAGDAFTENKALMAGHLAVFGIANDRRGK